MAAFPNYTENVPQMPESIWNSDNTFKHSIIADVYKVANNNLESIFPKHYELTACKINQENLLDFDYCGSNGGDPDVNLILDEAYGPTVYISVWIALVILFTIAGIIWCIFNKCCCCSSKLKKTNGMDYLVNTEGDDDIRGLRITDGEENNVKLIWKIVIGVLMGLLIIGFSFSVFISFASNEGLRKSIFEFYDDVIFSLDDADVYISTTQRQIEATFITSYGNLSEKVLDETSQFFDSMPHNMNINVQNILKLTDSLQKQLTALGNSGNGDDSDIMEFNGPMSHSLQLHTLETTLTNNVNQLIVQLEAIGKDFRTDVEEAIEKTGAELKMHANNLDKALNDVPINDIRKEIQNAEDNYLDVVGSAVYGSFMGFNLILLLILIGVAIGSVVVLIGKGSGKNTGFIFYRFSISMMFIFGWIVAFVMITQFVTSGFLTQIVCEAVRDMENPTANLTENQIKAQFCDSRMLHTLQTSNTSYQIPKYSHVVNNCKQDESAYVSFELKQVYDISSICNISDNFLSSITFPTLPTHNSNIDSFFIKNVNAVYSSLYKELVKLESFENSISNTSQLLESKEIKHLYSKLNFKLNSFLKEIKTLESGDFFQSGSANIDNIIQLVNDYENFVYNQVQVEIGKCLPLYRALNATIHTFCYKVLAPVASYWWSLQFLLFIFVAVICVALISERVFK